MCPTYFLLGSNASTFSTFFPHSKDGIQGNPSFQGWYLRKQSTIDLRKISSISQSGI